VGNCWGCGFLKFTYRGWNGPRAASLVEEGAAAAALRWRSGSRKSRSFPESRRCWEPVQPGNWSDCLLRSQYSAGLMAECAWPSSRQNGSTAFAVTTSEGGHSSTHRAHPTYGSQHPAKTATCANNKWCTGVLKKTFMIT
jgi:hypothetical protein